MNERLWGACTCLRALRCTGSKGHTSGSYDYKCTHENYRARVEDSCFCKGAHIATFRY